MPVFENKNNQISRFIELQLLGKQPVFPEIGFFKYLFNLIQDIGFFIYTDSGINVLSYSEIKSYLDITETKISEYELSIIKSLSAVYVNTYYEAKKNDFEAPYKED